MSLFKSSKLPGLLLVLFVIASLSCGGDTGSNPTPNPSETEGEKLTIFFINDAHGQLTNFAKIKHIVDEEKEKNPTLLVSAGDLFSGSPYVDQYADKGFPMIDIMNQTGFDMAVIGNHEFDYGLETLQARIEQSDFDWVCANVDVKDTGLQQPAAFKTLTVDGLKVTFLGLVETFGREGRVVPATHPWKIDGLEFEVYSDVVGQYENLKEQEGADLMVALTHLGGPTDRNMARQFPFFDLIIGGHTNELSTQSVNGIPTLMAGRNLFWLGKAELTIKDGELVDSDVSIIELWNYPDQDENLRILIENYTQDQTFEQVIGFSETDMEEIGEVGCFYTTALKDYMNVDVTLQNTGGIRNSIDQGDITTFEIFQMDPFNNGSVIYNRTVRQLKDFIKGSGISMAFTGVQLETQGNDVVIKDTAGNVLADDVMLKLGINDFIAALYDDFFPIDEAELLPLTTAETIIEYLLTVNSRVNFEGCERFYRF